MKNDIKTFFNTNPNVVINAKTLGKKLRIKKKDNDYFKSELHSLLREGHLLKNGKRYRLNRAVNKKFIGELQLANGQNYGFVIFSNKSLRDVFISEKHLNLAFDGETTTNIFIQSQSDNGNVNINSGVASGDRGTGPTHCPPPKNSNLIRYWPARG